MIMERGKTWNTQCGFRITSKRASAVDVLVVSAFTTVPIKKDGERWRVMQAAASARADRLALPTAPSRSSEESDMSCTKAGRRGTDTPPTPPSDQGPLDRGPAHPPLNPLGSAVPRRTALHAKARPALCPAVPIPVPIPCPCPGSGACPVFIADVVLAGVDCPLPDRPKRLRDHRRPSHLLEVLIGLSPPSASGHLPSRRAAGVCGHPSVRHAITTPSRASKTTHLTGVVAASHPEHAACAQRALSLGGRLDEEAAHVHARSPHIRVNLSPAASWRIPKVS